MPVFVTPRFLTVETCEVAVKIALRAVMDEGSPLHGVVKRHCCYIVVLVPGIQPLGHAFSDNPIRPVCIYQQGFGDRQMWSADYDKIAWSKALHLWQGRNDEKPGIERHLLFPGDTVYWGGVKRHGIVVSCSGVQPNYDQLIAGIAADSIKALAYSAFEASGDETRDFV